MPAGRTRTRPVTLSTYSLRTRSAIANTSAAVRIEHDLQQPLAVAQIDENDAAMVAAPMRPTGHRDDLPINGLADLAAIMSAHQSASAAPAWAVLLAAGTCTRRLGRRA